MSGSDFDSADGVNDPELQAYLQSRIPDAAPGYWDEIDARLERAAADSSHASDTGHDAPADTDASVVRPMGMETKTAETRIESNRGRVLLLAAAMVLLAGLGAFALMNRGDDDLTEVATATEPTATGEANTTTANQAAAAQTPQMATPAGPLTTLQLEAVSSLNANPARFCFTSDDALIVPASDADRRALAVLIVDATFAVELLVMQGPAEGPIIFAGSGLGNNEGRFVVEPLPVEGFAGGPPPFSYDVTLTDEDITLAISAEEAPVLDLVPCETVADRVDVLLAPGAPYNSEPGVWANPLDAVSASLAGEIPELSGEEEPRLAEPALIPPPYCFTSDDALFYPVVEDSDRRVLLMLNIGANGAVAFVAMQGDDTVYSGESTVAANGEFFVAPTVVVGEADQLPVYQFVISETGLSYGFDAPALDLVSCQTLSLRIDRMLELAVASDPRNPIAQVLVDDNVLSSAGVGPIKIGMTVAELSTLIGQDLTLDTIGLPAAGECGWLPDASGSGLDFLIELTSPTDGVVRRISTYASRFDTPSGMRVGVTEQTILDTFPGQIDSRPHVYVDGNYLTFIPNDANDPNTVEFVSTEGTITEIRVGDRGWVSFVEGCA